MDHRSIYTYLLVFLLVLETCTAVDMVCSNTFFSIPTLKSDEFDAGWALIAADAAGGSAKKYCKMMGFATSGSVRTRILKVLGSTRQTVNLITNKTCAAPQCVAIVGIECLKTGSTPCKADVRGNIGVGNIGSNNFGNGNKGRDNIGAKNIGTNCIGINNHGENLVGYNLAGNNKVSKSLSNVNSWIVDSTPSPKYAPPPPAKKQAPPPPNKKKNPPPPPIRKRSPPPPGGDYADPPPSRRSPPPPPDSPDDGGGPYPPPPPPDECPPCECNCNCNDYGNNDYGTPSPTPGSSPSPGPKLSPPPAGPGPVEQCTDPCFTFDADSQTCSRSACLDPCKDCISDGDTFTCRSIYGLAKFDTENQCNAALLNTCDPSVPCFQCKDGKYGCIQF